jgi:tRNA-uridine 2-sulfurtransferase
VPAGPIRVEAKTRYRQSAAPAQVVPGENGEAELRFDNPQFAVTPGQAAVFYQGDELIGGGWIRSAL